MVEFVLTPNDNQRIRVLCGECDGNLRHLEQMLQVAIASRGNHFSITGSRSGAAKAEAALINLYEQTVDDGGIDEKKMHLALRKVNAYQASNSSGNMKKPEDLPRALTTIATKRGVVTANTPNQDQYLKNILKHEITFGIGPAGTGKTLLAVACAVNALERGVVDRIVLARPAVEAGERLGFLPGNLTEKIDPYLRPLYDALYEMMDAKTVGKLIQANIIEIAPLAFMRGRTLNSSFIILDESQNTTVEQMKMFLTRIGFSSKVVVTGDITQIDLKRGELSGLIHVIEVFKQESELSFNYLLPTDVVRHPLVQKIIVAYETHQKKQSK